MHPFVWIILALQAIAMAMELWLGVAIVGWRGDNVIVERESEPGIYWFAVGLHIAMLLAVDLLVYFL